MPTLTFPENDRRIQYTASASQTVFPYDFPLIDQEYLEVYQNGTLLTLGTNYTVSGVGVQAGGNVTLTVGATVGDVIDIQGATPIERVSNYNNAGDYRAESINDDLNRLVQISQQFDRDLSRALVLSSGDVTTAEMTLPLKADRANKYLAFDVNGLPIASDASASGAAVSAFMETVLAATTSAAARALLEMIDSAKNRIINGSFDIWQRGTSFTVNGYTADRFYVDLGSGTGTVSQSAFSLGDSPGGGHSPLYGLRWNQTVAGTSAYLRQPVENVRTFSSLQVTFSFYAKVASGSSSFSSRMVQNFGTGGSPSTSVTSASKSHTVTTSWQRFTHTVTLGSVSGKTLGSGGNHYLGVELVAPDSTFDFFTWGWQLELGAAATAFAYDPLAVTLARCQRYYWKTFPLGTTPAQNAGRTGAIEETSSGTGANYSIISSVRFPVVMRATPATITTYNPSAANSSWRNIGGASDVAASVTSQSDAGLVVYNTGTCSDAAGHSIHVTADAEF